MMVYSDRTNLNLDYVVPSKIFTLMMRIKYIKQITGRF